MSDCIWVQDKHTGSSANVFLNLPPESKIPWALGESCRPSSLNGLTTDEFLGDLIVLGKSSLPLRREVYWLSGEWSRVAAGRYDRSVIDGPYKESSWLNCLYYSNAALVASALAFLTETFYVVVGFGASLRPIKAIFYLSCSSCSSDLIYMHWLSIKHKEIVHMLSIPSPNSVTYLVSRSIFSASLVFMLWRSPFSRCLAFSMNYMSPVTFSRLVSTLKSTFFEISLIVYLLYSLF